MYHRFLEFYQNLEFELALLPWPTQRIWGG